MEQAYAIEMLHITKRFPGIVANDDITLQLKKGEIHALLGAISWFYVMKKSELLNAVNTGSLKQRGKLWYSIGRYVYVPLALILCCVALFMQVAF